MSYPPRVRIVEVGPRDGLQNEAVIPPVAVKVALIDALARAGLTSIEAGSFVSPARVPAMAATAEVLAAMTRQPGVEYPVLVANQQGLQRALAAGVREVAVFGSPSESFSRRNINCGVAESLARFAPLVALAGAAGLRVRGYVSCVLGCPYEGAVAPEAVRDFARRLVEIGCSEVSLGDTIGVGTPRQARRLVETVSRDVPIGRVALHFHDTYGQALANILACLDLGVSGSRQRRGGPRRLPLCGRRHRQRRHGGSGVHAARHGHRDRRGFWIACAPPAP